MAIFYSNLHTRFANRLDLSPLHFYRPKSVGDFDRSIFRTRCHWFNIQLVFVSYRLQRKLFNASATVLPFVWNFTFCRTLTIIYCTDHFHHCTCQKQKAKGRIKTKKLFCLSLMPMKITKNDILFWLAIICAVWFAWAGMVWIYWAAIFIAYPFGLISFIIWKIIKKENKKRTKYIPIILGIGLILSLSVLIYLLIWE